MEDRVEGFPEFAHGYSYGDYFGVTWYGPPTEGFWLDELAVSNIYLDPLMRGIMDREERKSGGENLPKLVSDWNMLKGWFAGGGPVSILPADLTEFVSAVCQLDSSDVARYCAGCTTEDCLRCARVISSFIQTRLTLGLGVFLES